MNSHTPLSATQRTLHFVQQIFWQGKVRHAFWSISGGISLIVNIILIVILVVMGQQLFSLKKVVKDQLLGGLYTNFVLMDKSTIQTTVSVEDTIPVQFDLPVDTVTTVILTEDTPIEGARVDLRTGGLNIVNAPANITLPAGTPLKIALNISVPVDTTVPVTLTVPVNIPLNTTELHHPFVGLQQVLSPYYILLAKTPDSWQDFLCPPMPARLCSWLDAKPASP